MTMMDGKTVTYRTGRAHYKAISTGQGSGWVYMYTLEPLKGGPKRFNVSEEDLHEVLAVKGTEVDTTVGPVKVPDFRRFRTASGGTRRTYIGAKWVFKRPLGDWAQERNRVEAARWAHTQGQPITHLDPSTQREVTAHYKDVPIAECYLLPDGTLMMERVRTLYNIGGKADVPRDQRPEFPEWTRAVDSDQIGLNRHGDIVAYDL
jgi:hypothetical protein